MGLFGKSQQKPPRGARGPRPQQQRPQKPPASPKPAKYLIGGTKPPTMWDYANGNGLPGSGGPAPIQYPQQYQQPQQQAPGYGYPQQQQQAPQQPAPQAPAQQPLYPQQQAFPPTEVAPPVFQGYTPPPQPQGMYAAQQAPVYAPQPAAPALPATPSYGGQQLAITAAPTPAPLAPVNDNALVAVAQPLNDTPSWFGSGDSYGYGYTGEAALPSYGGAIQATGVSSAAYQPAAAASYPTPALPSTFGAFAPQAPQAPVVAAQPALGGFQQPFAAQYGGGFGGFGAASGWGGFGAAPAFGGFGGVSSYGSQYPTTSFGGFGTQSFGAPAWSGMGMQQPQGFNPPFAQTFSQLPSSASAAPAAPAAPAAAAASPVAPPPAPTSSTTA